MANPRLLLRRILCVAAAAAFLSAPVSAIRKDIGFAAPIICRTTVQGRHLISDDNGYVCSALSIDPWSRCCPQTGERFSCQGCNLDSQCCNSYEYCVSCCLNPSMTKEADVLKLKVAKPVTAANALFPHEIQIEPPIRSGYEPSSTWLSSLDVTCYEPEVVA
ncbi:unnamed protein product [Triticum turgidum subsp. durum]|uniref:SREBP regulating gene protein n=1 Tax=Triticum turgidum subsp. durum TaxID=4567 RepID=A0A9R0SF66_TRITD|nr:unnamed protein product [Triticum turgidum subsp. durum]